MAREVSPRIYWRCRRGMAELDSFLHGFLKHDYQKLNDDEKASFEKLLNCNDTELLEYLMGRTTPPESGLINVVSKIRQSTRS